MTDSSTLYQRAKYFYGFAVIVLFLRFINGGLFSSVCSAPFVFPEADNTYWLYLLSGADQLMKHYFLCVILDMLLLFLPVCSLLFFEKKIFPILFTLLLSFYLIVYNSHTAFHSHSLAGFIFISIAFWFKQADSFSLAWRSVRYYFIFVMVSAAGWKFYRDGIYHFDQFSNILKAQHIEYFSENTEGLFYAMRHYLIQNETVSYILLLCGFIAEASFVIGFFSRQYDKLLLASLLLFFVFNFIVTGISNFEFAVFALLLIDWDNEVKPLFS